MNVFHTPMGGSIAIEIKAGSGWPSSRKGAKAKERKRVGSWKHVGGRGRAGKGAGADKTLVGHIFAAGGRLLLERSSTIAGWRLFPSLGFPSIVIFQRFYACFAKKMLAAGNFAVFRVLGSAASQLWVGRCFSIKLFHQKHFCSFCLASSQTHAQSTMDGNEIVVRK